MLTWVCVIFYLYSNNMRQLYNTPDVSQGSHTKKSCALVRYPETSPHKEETESFCGTCMNSSDTQSLSKCYQYSHDGKYIHWLTVNVHLIDLWRQWFIPLGTNCNLFLTILTPLRITHLYAHCSSQWISLGAYHPVRQKCTIITVYWFHMSPTAASWPPPLAWLL